MKFENAFTVQAPARDVWAALMDVERVAPCMPGAEVLERISDDAYKVGIKVKVGPMSMVYRGQVEIVERDEAARRATMRAKAKESRGQGTADAHVHMSLLEQPDGTQATLETEVQLSGKAAAMGQGVIGDVSAKLVETFAANLAEMLVPTPAAAPRGAAPAERKQPEPGTGVGPAPPGNGAAPPSSAHEHAGAGPPPPPSRPKPAQDSLPIGQIAASVIAGRLKDPRALLIAGAAVAFVFGAIGYAIGRKR
jgi:carbon monoxide dehydrogenase subunit G